MRFVVALFAALAGCAAAGEASLFEQLVAKRDASATGVVNLNTKTFHRFVTAERDYHLLLFFTATNAACAACRAATEPLDHVAGTLRRAFPAGSPALAANGTGADPMARVFVARADYPKCQEVFQTHPNLTGVPHLVYVAPGPAAAEPPAQLRGSTKWLPGFSSRNEYALISQTIDPQEVMGWLHKRARGKGAPTPIYVDPLPGIIRMLVLILTVPTAIVFVMAMVGARRICLSFAMVMQFFIMGGGLYCMIRNSPPMNGTDFMFRYSGNQTQTEGFVVAFFTALGALGIVGLNSRFVVGPAAAKASSAKIYATVFTAVTAIAFYKLRALYISKSPGYLTYTA